MRRLFPGCAETLAQVHASRRERSGVDGPIPEEAGNRRVPLLAGQFVQPGSADDLRNLGVDVLALQFILLLRQWIDNDLVVEAAGESQIALVSGQ